MKAKVRILVNDSSFDVSVQEGRQTIRWLGVVVQNRLRATKNAFNKKAESCFVTGLYNLEGDLLDPKQKIEDYAQWDNMLWTVEAKTCEKFPADEWGNPAYEDWAAAAYLHSDHTFTWAVEMNQWRSKAGYYQPNDSQAGDSVTADGSMIQIGDRPIADVAFELDWSVMKWTWLEMPVIGQGKNAVTLDRGAEINNIKAALAERYDLILVIFQHYCGAGEIGERYGMSTLEFSHFLRLCGIVVQGNADSYTVEPPREKMEAKEDAKGDDHDDDDQGSKAEESVAFFEEAMKAFVEVTVKTTAPSAAVTADVGTASLFESSVVAEAKNPLSAGGSSVSSGDGSVVSRYSSALLSRPHFAVALVEVAMQRMPTVAPAEATVALLDDAMFPVWQNVCLSYAMYQEYEEDSVFRMFFHDNYYILKRQFLHYSHGAIIAQSKVEEQRALLKQGPPSIDVDKIVQIFRSTLYVGSALTDEEVEGEIVSAFLRVQLNQRGGASQEYREAVFVEFLEMIASIGLQAVDKETSGLSEGKRLRMAFNYIVESSPGFRASSASKK